MTVSAALNAENIRLRTYAPGTQKTTCPHCSHDRKKRNEPCLSVTIEPDGGAVWRCHHCPFAGGFSGESWERDRQRPRKTYKRPARVPNPQQPDSMLAWFQRRGISEATVKAAGIYRTRHWFPQLQAEADCIAFPFEWQGELRNVKYRDKDKTFAQEKDAEPVLYGADSIAAETIWVEGEMDVLAMREAGFEHVVTLPNGASKHDERSDRRYAPLETHAEDLEKVQRFLIATDMDEAGEKLANELARRLGKDRCWRVRFPDLNDVASKDVNECLVNHGKEVLRECVANAEPWPIDGLHDAADFRGEVLDLYHGRGPKALSTGFEEMDHAFRILPGQFVVVTGIPNHGKSQWLDQVAIQTARVHGWNWAMFSPEGGGAASHLTTLAEIWAGAPFYDGPNQKMSEDELQHALAWIQRHVTFIEAKDHTPSIDWILERARAAVLRKGINALILDPYNEIEASRPRDQTETEFVSQLISKCKRFAATHDVTVFMVVHPTKLQSAPGDPKDPIPGLYDLSGSAHWRNKADAGLVVYRDFEEDCTFVIAKKIRRQPVCGRPGAVRFFFNPVLRRYTDEAGSFQPMGTRKRSNDAAFTA